jgi:hypothetical protein
MSDEVRVEVQELRLVLARVLDAVEARFGSSVDLRADVYWTLDLARSFDSYADHSGLIVGQLSDDVQELRGLLGRAEGPTLWHDLSHIVGILRRIAALDLPSDTVP